MSFLSRDQILNAVDIVTEEVDVPEWGGKVLVRGLSGTERDQLEATLVQMKGKNSTANLKNLRAKLVVLAVVDETGKRLFGEDDVTALGKKSAAALDRVYTKAALLSGISEADQDELTKNSESDQS
jgi:hypothetical protein